MSPTTDRDGSEPSTPSAVAALAAAQMRAARHAFEARDAWLRAQEAYRFGAPYDDAAARVHRDAQRVLAAADRAYHAACDQFAAELAPPPAEQPGLF